MVLTDYLVSPVYKKPAVSFDDTGVEFGDGERYPIVNGIPILIGEKNGLFELTEIVNQKPQTQNKKYLDKSIFKNYVRRNILPTLSADRNVKSRYEKLANKVKGQKVLIVGAGDKVEYYREIFHQSEVITSDVHLQFSPDLVLDVHSIPFPDEFFHLILAGQVMEHTIRPWIASAELQRVTAPGGWLQIEVPFAFPYHAAPYDFFRFTFTGMRSLFPLCELRDYNASEGIFSAVAIVNAQALVEVSRNKYIRYFMLVFGRFAFFWLKYFDRLKKGGSFSDFIMPKGYYMTFVKDGKARSDRECLHDFNILQKRK